MIPRLLAAAALIVVAGFALVHECSYGGGMGASYRQCKCRGVEWVLYDHTPADGPRRSLCIGLVTSRRCFRYIGGPEIDCRDRRRPR